MNKDGHVICMRVLKNALKIQAWKLETKILLGGPKRNGGEGEVVLVLK
jgi:hypothetical protein